MEKCKQAAASADIVSIFDCHGELAQEVTELLKKSDDPKMRAFGERGSQTKGQLDDARLKRARKFARETIERLFG